MEVKRKYTKLIQVVPEDDFMLDAFADMAVDALIYKLKKEKSTPYHALVKPLKKPNTPTK